MLLRALCALAGLIASGFAAAQEPEYFPYEPESEERMQMLLPDSALFFRAVQSADDLFGRTTDYEFSFVRSQRRGLDWDTERATLNGVAVSWRYFGALRALGAEERLLAGLANDEHGGVGGANGLRTFRVGDAELLPAGRVAAGCTGRNYLVALKGNYAGVWGRGWDYAAAFDARTGRDLVTEGIFTNSVSGSFRATKRWRNGVHLSLLTVVSPSMRGLRSMTTEEAIELTGNRQYNPSWGLQNGEVRNARIRRELVPLFVAAYAMPLSRSTELEATLGVEAGWSEYSTLGWYDARTPLPDNYRNLPSYTGDRETEEAWRANDVRYTQIDWDELWAVNRMAGGEAVYAVEGRVEQLCNVQAHVGFVTQVDDRLTLTYGADVQRNSSRCFKRMRDLLGASYLTDIDQYLIDDDTYGNRLQNDLRCPNRRIGTGDRFGYDYALTTCMAMARVQAHYRADRLRADVAAEVGEGTVRRRGYFEKELFPGTASYGPSAVMHFAPYCLKAAVGWAFTPKCYLGLAAMTSACLPEADDLFLQPQYNNRTAVDGGAPTEKLWAVELDFHYTNRTVDLRAAAFYYGKHDGIQTRRYYDDLSGCYSDLVATGIGTCGYGIEAATTVRLSYRWRLSLAATLGRYEYDRDPSLAIYADTDNTPVVLDAVSHMGGCRVGNAPQAELFGEVLYFGPHGWGFNVSTAYAGGRYVEPAFLRRTERVALQAASSPEALAQFVEQERLDDAVTLGASLFKTFYFANSRLTLSLMLRNLLNDRDMVYAAYESLRVRRSRSGDFYVYAPFETRRSYSYPRSFYLSISYRF